MTWQAIETAIDTLAIELKNVTAKANLDQKLIEELKKKYIALLDASIKLADSLKTEQVVLAKRLPTMIVVDKLKNLCLALYSNVSEFLVWFRKVMDIAGFTPYTVEKGFTLKYRKECLDKLAVIPKNNSMFDLANPSGIGVLLPQQIYPYAQGKVLLVMNNIKRFLSAFKRFRNTTINDPKVLMETANQKSAQSTKDTKERLEDIYQKFSQHQKLTPYSYFDNDREKHLKILFSGLLFSKLFVFKRSSIENLGTERYTTLVWQRYLPLQTIDPTTLKAVVVRVPKLKEEMRVRVNKMGYYPCHMLSLTGAGFHENPNHTDSHQKMAYDLNCPTDPKAYIPNYGVHDFERMLNEALFFSSRFVMTQHPKIFSTIPDTQHSQVFSVDYFSDKPHWHAEHKVLAEQTICAGLKQVIKAHANDPDMVSITWELSDRGLDTQQKLIQQIDQFKLSCLQQFGGYARMDFWPYTWVNKQGAIEIRLYPIAQSQLTVPQLELKIQWPSEQPKHFFSEMGEKLWQQLKLPGLNQFAQKYTPFKCAPTTTLNPP